MKGKRESFVFYRSFYEAISECPDDVQLELYKAIAFYSFSPDEEPQLTGVAKALWIAFKPQLDANNRRYLNGLKGAEHGAKGGAPVGNNNAKKEAEQGQTDSKTTPKQPQNNPKTTPNVNDNDNDNDLKKKELLSSSSKKERQQQFNKPTLQEVADYCFSMGYTFSPEAFHAYYESNGWKVGRNQMKNWKAACVTWQKKERENGNNRRNNEAVTTDEQVIRNTYELIAEAEGRDALGTVRMPF